MNKEPCKAYVYQPFPPIKSGKSYGVGGLETFGLTCDEANVRGVTKDDATEIVRFCNKNSEFAKSFIKNIKKILKV